MPGMEFEYDEEGTIIYYFILAVIVIILLPWTVVLLRRKKNDGPTLNSGPSCNCEPCLSKRELLKQKPVSNKIWAIVSKIIYVTLWILLFACLYKVSTIELEFKEFDPFAELEIDQGAAPEEIKKAYRKLSKEHHPDKGGDSKRFIRIAKAYQTLTNEETRKNWEEYGNPDGPGAMQFGIALPKWLVEKENSMVVLGIYAFAFMIVLPVAVGVWWYRSIKFSAEHVLLETEKIYHYFFRKHPNCILKKIIQILSISREFGRQWNQEIIERPSDNGEVPALIRKLQHINEQPREMPYILKTRALIHAHLSRVPLPQSTLEQDRRYIVKKCPLLVGEMVQIVSQLCLARVYSNIPPQTLPRLNTVEAVMQLYSMIIQGCWDNKSNLMQLPHFTEELVRSLSNKRGRSIRTINDLANLAEPDRRQALWSLSDDQYRDVIEVLRNIPFLEMQAKPEVIDVDDEDPSITAGSIVTVILTIRRGSLAEVMTAAAITGAKKNVSQELENDLDENNEKAVKKEIKPWQKHGGKKKKNVLDPRQHKAKAKNPKEKPKLTPQNQPASPSEIPNESTTVDKAEKSEEECESDGDSDRENQNRTASENDDNSDNDDAISPGDSKKDEEDEEERRWRRFNEAKRDNSDVLAGLDPTQAPMVHCPYVPIEKYESWWVYICDRKKMELLTPFTQVSGLKPTKPNSDTQFSESENNILELPVKFKAPEKPGIYQYSVCCRSDCYLGVDALIPLKLDVRTAPQIEVPRVETESEGEGSDEDDDGVRRRRGHNESEYSSDEDYSDSDSD